MSDPKIETLPYPHEHPHMEEHFAAGHLEHVTDYVPKAEIAQGYTHGDPSGGADGEDGGEPSDE